VIHEDPAHHLGCDAEELRAVAPGHPALIDEAQIRLVHESCRLQGVAGSFTSKVGGSAAAKFLVDERHQQVACSDIALAPGLEKLSNLVLGGVHSPSGV
jgi:hypothetical protein